MKVKNRLLFGVAFAIAATSTPLLASRDEDSRIEAAAKQSYVYRTYLKNEKVDVQSKDGCVTLKGKVSSEPQKGMAADTVENLPGVKSVDNQIEVKAAKEKSDDWLEWKVKSALLYRRSVSGAKTKVSVQDGMVTLEGVASSQAQKELTEEYAKDVEGVKSVKNLLTVSPAAEKPDRTVGQVIDDASITAQVKSALLTHRSTSPLKTKVKTVEGEVTIAGEAKNQAEKDLVTKLASDIHGVKRVVNNMEVKG